MDWNSKRVKIKATIEVKVPEGDYCKKERTASCGCCDDEYIDFSPCGLLDYDTCPIWGDRPIKPTDDKNVYVYLKAFQCKAAEQKEQNG